MYASLRNRPASGSAATSRSPIPRVVVLLGFTSMFTDISSEMVAAILPVYLTLQLGLSPVQYGIVDGLYNGVSAVSRLAAGITADRLRRAKGVAALGYGLSAAVTRPLLLLASTASGVAALVTVDRIGKGIRTAPRDSMISEASPPVSLGRNFGVHRAMDNFGAMLGPLLAFGILILLPNQYDAVFVVSSAMALLGLLVLVLLVPAKRPTGAAAVKLRIADLVAMRRLPGFTRLVSSTALLTAFTVSDAFVFLAMLERNDGLATWFPLFAVVLALSYALLAVPIGRLADRVGRTTVFVLGHAVMLAVYLLAGRPAAGAPAVCLVLVLMGLYYAATDGVLAASVSDVMPEVTRATGLAAAATVTALAALVSSIGFGLLVGWLGWGRAFLVMGIGATLAMLISWVLLADSRRT